MPREEEAVQLLSGSRRKLDVTVPGENRPLYIGLAMLLAVGGIFWLADFYLNTLKEKMTTFDNDLIALEKRRDKKFEQEALVWDKRLSLAGGLVRKHVIWSGVLEKLEALTPPTVQFLNLQADFQENRIQLEATAPNYTTIARAIAALSSDPGFADIALNKIAGLTSGFLKYDSKITFQRNKLLFGGR